AKEGSKPWGTQEAWFETVEVGVRLAEVRKEAVCVLKADLEGVLADLPGPVPGGSRICVDRYASLVSIVHSGAAVGFVPLLEREPARRRDYPGIPGLIMHRIAKADGVPTRKVCLWRREGEQLPETVTRFLACASGKD